MAQRKRTSKSKATSKRTAKKKLDNLNVVDGKAQDIAKIKELQELMGIKQSNPFGVTTASDLEQKMDDMNLSDLQALAVKAGLFPSGSRLTLKNKLLKEFYSTPGAGAGVDVGFQGLSQTLTVPKGKT